MSLIIFTTTKDFSVKLISEEATKQSKDCFVYYYPDITCNKNKIYNKNEPILISKKDNIILRDPFQGGKYNRIMSRILIKFYPYILLDKKCFKKYPRYEDKLFQARFFQRNKITIPETYSISKVSSFPIVIKKKISSRGKGNFLLKSHDELEKFLKQRNHKDYILQDYKKAEGDYRILILKNKILGIVSRRVKLKKDNSLKVKVKKSYNKLPKSVTNTALKIARQLGADLVGVDVILSQGKYFFLEANIAPQFKGFTRISGINVAKKIIDLIA